MEANEVKNTGIDDWCFDECSKRSNKQLDDGLEVSIRERRRGL